MKKPFRHSDKYMKKHPELLGRINTPTRKWVTEIKALDPNTGEMKSWGGPEVPGINARDAEIYCQNNGLGYCMVLGELIAEIPCKDGTYEPDFENMTDYEQPTLN